MQTTAELLLNVPRPSSQNSPLQSARLQRRLTREEAARRADLSPDEVVWLEEGRLYRFPSTHIAVSAVLSYGSTLGIDRRKALELAGRPAAPKAAESIARLVGAAALAALLAVAAAALVALSGSGQSSATEQLPPPWRVSVDVLNGSGDINQTRRLADRIGSLAYQVERVQKADRFDYPETAVYYQPGGKQIGGRLAEELGVSTKPLPGGKNPRRLVVIVGPATIRG